MPVPRRHGARAWFVPVSVQRSAGAGTPPQSPLLRAVLEELDRSGTGWLEFWQRVWRALPYLSDEDLVRLARTVGPVARVSLRRLGVAEARCV